MMPAVFRVLNRSDGYVSFGSICSSIRTELPAGSSEASSLQSKVRRALDDAYACGLVNQSENRYKISFDLGTAENPQFETKLKVLKREIQQAKKSTRRDQQAQSTDPREGSSQAAGPRDCGPGWRRRPVAQRQAIAIYRRMKAERQGRSPRRDSSSTRGRSRSRSRSRRSRSRSRRRTSRSRSRSRGGNRSRSR
ncbi:arginine/serine-rich coiled-coil protein 2-like [Wyeomyia smithii]|uniref:arginine/serine-rich coiled-coil protein 2-like n=1 Tax=Wyeomyia smithii TaxID=174621 RepID=UPI0024681C18|nr:arginine/serine-rich coiled-coil protein 2-like [Wyeomyia smithii]